MSLLFSLKRHDKAKNGLLLTITRQGQSQPFVTCKPLNKHHAQAIKSRFASWSAQGWPPANQ